MTIRNTALSHHSLSSRPFTRVWRSCLCYSGLALLAISPASRAFTAPNEPAFDAITTTTVRSTAPALDAGATWHLERATGNATFTSPSTTNLVLWLKADSIGSTNGPVSSWADSSPSGNSAVQGAANFQPRLMAHGPNDRPVVRFDGIDDYLLLPRGFGDFTAGFSAFVVMRPTPASAVSRVFNLGNGVNNENVTFRLEASGASTTAASYEVIKGASARSNSTAVTLQNNRWQVMSVVHDTGSIASMFKNADPSGTAAVNLPRLDERSLNYIGRSIDSTEVPFSGDIAEILIYNTALTSTQRAAVDTYLASKWGTPFSGTGISGLTWTSISPTQTTGSVYSDATRSAAQTNWYRYNDTGSTATGKAASVQTAPGAPGAPAGYSAVTSSSLVVTAPATMPTGTQSLTLQIKAPADPGFSNYAKGFAANDTVAVYSLSPSTSYQFRFVAEGPDAGTAGTASSQSTTATPAVVPGPPTIVSVGPSFVTVRAPELPTGIVSLRLEIKESRAEDSGGSGNKDYETAQRSDTSPITGLTANAVATVGLLWGEIIRPSKRLSLRYVGVKADTTTVNGTPIDVTTLPQPVLAPGQASFSNLTATGVTVTAPNWGTGEPLPRGATSLDLQMRPENSTAYTTVATNVAPLSSLDVAYPIPTTQRNYYFRFVSVGLGDRVPGLERAPTTLPFVPVVTTGTIGAQSVTFDAPIETGANWNNPAELNEGAYLRNIQFKLSTEPDTAYIDCTGLSGMSPPHTDVATRLAPNTIYDFRWLINSNRTGIAVGPATRVTTLSGTQPAMPGAPTFTIIGPDRVTITAPSTTLATLRAHHLRLEDAAGTVILSTIAPGASTTVTGLTASTVYSYRLIAAGTAGGAPETTGSMASVTTISATPEIPGVPVVGTSTANSIDVTLPPIVEPLRTASLTLQYKLSQGTADFADWGTTHPGGTALTVTGLTAGRSYQFRCKALPVVGAAVTLGPIAGGATTVGAPSAPGAPASVTKIDSTTANVVAPATLPTNADWLTLQVLPVNQGTAVYSSLDTNLNPGDTITVSGLTPGGVYRFRYLAVGSGGSTAGPAATDVTMDTSNNTWASVPVAIETKLSCDGIRTPTAAVSVAQGATLRCSSYLATDWDELTTPTGTYRYTDTCVYLWTVTTSGGVNAGSFVNSLSQAQSVVWTAPATPGTYTLKLTVSDQNNQNIAIGDMASRYTDGTTPTTDTPLVFTRTITVP